MAPKTWSLLAWLAFLLPAVTGCSGPQARSNRSFDEIQALARGKTAQQILHLLGEPDSRQEVFDAGERWIWWNYTFLDGKDCPPEMRGRVVHLEVVVRDAEKKSEDRRPYSEWKVDEPFGITYRTPAKDG